MVPKHRPRSGTAGGELETR